VNKKNFKATKIDIIYIIWEYISKLVRFFISVLIGFFLTTIYPIFKLLKNRKTQILVSLLLMAIVSFFYMTVKLMLGYTE
jgi:Protein of unknown function (DUF751)